MALTLEQIKAMQAKKSGTLNLAQMRQAQGTSQKEPGIVQGIAQGIAKPVLRTLSSVASTIGTLRGDKNATGQRDFGYFGKVSPVGFDSQGKSLGVIRGTADAFGVGADITSNLVGGSGALKVIKPTLAGKIGQGAWTGLKSGLGSGLLYGLGSGLQEEVLEENESLQQDPLALTRKTLFSGAIGAAGGAVLGGLAPVPKAAINKTKELADVDALTNKIANQYRKTLNLGGRQIQIERKGAKDTAKFLAEEGIPLKVNQGRLDSTEAIAVLSQKAEIENDAFGKLLQEDGGYSNVDSILRKAKGMVTDLGSAKTKATNYIGEEFAALKNQFKTNGFTDEAGDFWIRNDVANKWKQDFYTKGWKNPLATLDDSTKAGASRLAGRSIKESIEESVKDASIKQFSQRLGDFAEALTMLKKRDGMPVAGGRLGRMFGRAIGAAIGSHGGVPGSIGGAITGDQLVDLLQNPKLTTWAARKLLLRLSKENPSLLGKIDDILAARRNLRAERPLLEAPKTIYAQPYKGNPNPPGAQVIRAAEGDPIIKQGNTGPQEVIKTYLSGKGEASGVFMGIERDEEGNFKFNKEKAVAGLALTSGFSNKKIQELLKKSYSRFVSKREIDLLETLGKLPANEDGYTHIVNPGGLKGVSGINPSKKYRIIFSPKIKEMIKDGTKFQSAVKGDIPAEYIEVIEEIGTQNKYTKGAGGRFTGSLPKKKLTSDLAQEARKYKSAEEFVDTRLLDKPIKNIEGNYGETKTFKVLEQSWNKKEPSVVMPKGSTVFRGGKDGVYYSADLGTAEGYAGSNLVKAVDISGKKLANFQKFTGGKYASDPDVDLVSIVRKALDDGYDGLYTRDNYGEVILPTKSQLTDIWNTANKGNKYLYHGTAETIIPIIENL